ncbi:MAG: hypothetical protein K8S99_05900 [Planctomycetes bacterium]|nr:hypothetical protein [Planctomycetota bacterium]
MTHRRNNTTPRTSRRHGRRDSGVAMMLVMIALTIGTILAMSFLTAQSTTIGITQNLQKQPTARMIAETALAAGVQAVLADTNWRTNHASGAWVTNQSFGGGTYTLSGQDGVYSAASNSVVGDGSLSNNPTDPLTLTATGTYSGTTYTVRAAVTTSSIETPTPGGLNANDSITLGTSTYVDAFDSGVGAYGGSNIILNRAMVNTNSTGSAKIALSGSAKINGNANAGPGGSTSTVISVGGSASITGTKSVLASAVVMNLPTAPTGMPSSSGALNVSTGTVTISSNAHYSSISVTGTGILNITSNAVVLVDGNVAVNGSGQITLGAVGACKLYVNGGGVTVSGTGQVAVSTGDPTRFQIFLLTASQNIALDTSARVYAKLLAPGGSVTLTNSAQVYGTVICKQFSADSTTATHIDIGSGNPGSTPTDFGNKTLYTTKTKSVSSKQVATQLTLATGGTLQSITGYFKGAASKSIRFAIYTDSAGSPGTLLAQSAVTTLGTGTVHWVTIAMPATTLTAGTYWLAFSTNASNTYYYNNGSASGKTRYRNNAAVTAGFLSTWGTSDTSLTRTFNIYAAVVSGGASTGITPPTLPIYSYDSTWGENP